MGNWKNKLEKYKEDIETVMPGGFPYVVSGVVIALVAGILSMVNILFGVGCVAIAGVLAFSYSRAWIHDENVAIVACSILATIPFVVLFCLLLWLVVAIVTGIALLIV